MKHPYKILCLISALTTSISYSAYLTVKSLSKEEAISKMYLQDRFPSYLSALTQGRNRVTYDNDRKNYSITFDNEYFTSNIFALNPEATVCAWDTATGIRDWRSLIIANLQTGEKTTLKESHYEKLHALCINDAGDKIITIQPDKILISFLEIVNNRISLKYKIKVDVLPKEQSFKYCLTTFSPTGDTFAVTSDSENKVLDIYSIIEKKITFQRSIEVITEDKISDICLISDGLLVNNADSNILFSQSNLDNLQSTKLPVTSIKKICRSSSNPESVIAITEKDDQHMFFEVTLNRNNKNPKKRAHEE